MFGAGSPDVMAQKSPYPNRPIRLIVPFAPGGGVDILARTLSPKLTGNLGQSVVVDNRAGGGGSLGAEIAARAAPDGYTLILGAASYTTNAALYTLSYHPLDDITPIALVCLSGHLVAVHPGVPVKSISELITYAKENPVKLNFGSSGVGGLTHLATELFNMMTGIRMNHVPYKGTGPALNELLGGHIQVVFGGVSAGIPHLKANRLRGIGVTNTKRWKEIPDIPSISETVPGYEATLWYAVWGPKNLPKEVVMRWNSEIGRIVQLPDMKDRMLSEGLDPVGGTPQQFRQVLKTDIAKWTDVVRQANLKGSGVTAETQ